MIYTSGIMSSATKRETLEELQQRKLETVCHKINLKPGEKMLDIGCGWGTLSVHAAKEGASVTGVTLGRNQTQWANTKAAEANVSDNVRILCMDYRDIPFEKYDKVTCLEMAEHVGVLRFSTFLAQVREMLNDDGMFFLQIAGLRRAWQYEDLQWGVSFGGPYTSHSLISSLWPSMSSLVLMLLCLLTGSLNKWNDLVLRLNPLKLWVFITLPPSFDGMRTG